MNALEISLLGVIALLGVTMILITLQFFKALRNALDHADNVHARAQSHLDTTLDRLMAMDFATFKAYQSADKADEGHWEDRDPDEAAEERPFATLMTEREELQESHSLSGARLP